MAVDLLGFLAQDTKSGSARSGTTIFPMVFSPFFTLGISLMQPPKPPGCAVVSARVFSKNAGKDAPALPVKNGVFRSCRQGLADFSHVSGCDYIRVATGGVGDYYIADCHRRGQSLFANLFHYFENLPKRNRTVGANASHQ